MPEPELKIITIDGPAGAGKSTVAKRLAEKLKIAYLDTGAMYRALTLKAMRSKIDLADEGAMVDLAKNTCIDLVGSGNANQVLLDGEDVSQEIRTVEVTNNTFYAARAPRVREIMVGWQRDIGHRRSVVVEGRDAGTVIFPEAKYKFYLDADVQERSRRRYEELRAKGQDVDDQKLTEEIKDRDQKDLSRSTGPLKKADDAVMIDSTRLSIEGVVDEMLKYIQEDPTFRSS